MHAMVGKFEDQVTYLDLFFVKMSNQGEFEKTILIDLKVKLLRLLHSEIVRLSPKLIIINNRQALAYWTGYEIFTWLGYQYESILASEFQYPGKEKVEVLRIVGV